MSLSFLSRFNRHDNAQQQNGLWIMILAMLLIPSVDVLAKLLSKDLGPVQISFLRVAFQAVFLLVAIRGLPRLIHSAALTKKLLIASLLVNLAVTSMVWSLVSMPVANAVALFFIEPLLVMLLSSLLLKEKSAPIKYLLALVGLAGALVVIRPNFQLYGWSSVLPMLAALFYALYLITVRTVRSQIATSEMQAYISLAGIIMMGAILLTGQISGAELLDWSPIQLPHWHLLILLGFFSALTHWMISTAFSLSKATTLAPLRYLEIISATALGYLVFGDYPDILTWTGTAIILGSGLCLIHLDRKREARNS
ncbi:DMT family transporter [Oceanospirillum sediminis]|uniref:DMT family transporter n=1 Tax=Oceanospirillum sediminis TaxID=2760088 RepID=A0A839IU76_9GAMM|nr:DMT family transporter [Oceanospirillum sediminis]MBB1489003.1 DMT family transporter [Oceanospirillum sediminis]